MNGLEISKLPADEPEQLLIKSQDTSNPEFGCSPHERDMETLFEYGVINLDKPSGPTSHEVASWARKILGIEKTGHGGTLDPKVTGILPCALGRATRVVSALLSAGKEYVCAMRLHTPHLKKQIEKVLKIFTGELYQRPPLKSSVARVLRTREVYYCNIIEMDYMNDSTEEKIDKKKGPKNLVLFRIGCEAGTYIRKYCFDIGEALLSGAHMAELRRTRVGKFTENEMLVTLQDLKDAFTLYQQGEEKYLRQIIFPMEKMVEHVPKIFVRDTAVDALCHGADLAAAGICFIDARIKENTDVAYMTLKKEIIGFGKATKNAMTMLKANKGIMAKTNKIFMDRGTYPHWSDNK